MNAIEKITNTMAEDVRNFFNFEHICEEEDNPFTINLHNMCERQIGPILFHHKVWIKGDGQDLTTICVPEYNEKNQNEEEKKKNQWIIAQRICAYYTFCIYPVIQKRKERLFIKPFILTPKEKDQDFIETLTLKFLMPEKSFVATARNLECNIKKLSQIYCLKEDIIKKRIHHFKEKAILLSQKNKSLPHNLQHTRSSTR